MAERKRKTLGTYVEAQVDHLDDGEFKVKLSAALRQAVAGLEQYEKASGSTAGKAKLVCSVTFKRSGADHVAMDYEFDVKVPRTKRTTMVRAVGGRLLVNPEGDSLNNKDQLQLRFDRFGNPSGAVDTATGEVLEDDAPGITAHLVTGAKIIGAIAKAKAQQAGDEPAEPAGGGSGATNEKAD